MRRPSIPRIITWWSVPGLSSLACRGNAYRLRLCRLAFIRLCPASQQRPVSLARTKEHRGSFARAVVAYLGQELGAIKLNEVAARYGRDQVTLSLGVKRLRDRLAQESDLSENIASLLKQLRGGRVKINN